jgi:uncharacterized protein YdeI (YjbR/CyaY-like superfamily)
MEIGRDKELRTVELPPELAAALATVDDGRRRWDALPWYHQREVAEYVSEAKRPETRRRRAEKAVHEHLG